MENEVWLDKINSHGRKTKRIERLETVLIDFDGTIVDSHPLLYAVYCEFLAQFKKQGAIQEFAHLNGPDLLEIVTYLKQQHHITEPIHYLFLKYHSLLVEIYHKRVEAFKGVEQCFKLLKENNCRLFIVSSCLKDVVESCLVRLELIRFVDGIFDAAELKYSKPHPEIYLRALIETQANMQRTLVIEDSIAGLRAALEAQLYCAIAFGQWRSQDLEAIANVYKRAMIKNLEDWQHITQWLCSDD